MLWPQTSRTTRGRQPFSFARRAELLSPAPPIGHSRL